MMGYYTNMEWGRSALMIIDMQYDFVEEGGAAHIKGTQEIVPEIRDMANTYRSFHRPVIHVVRLYQDDGSNVDVCRKHLIQKGRRIVSPGSKGARVVSELLPEKPMHIGDGELIKGGVHRLSDFDFMLYKPRWGAFYHTVLEEWLMAHGVNSLLVAGCNFPNCPRTSMYEASERDYRLAIVPSAISGIYPQGIKELEGIGVNVYGPEELRNAMEQECAPKLGGDDPVGPLRTADKNPMGT
ncbi:isochorismatase family cysteine hydrolase [Flagellimonas sp.]|uniref:isochorismatase family cysteine hydrolase n=1 Tax=Flagellimonas sp. TaxID=2058762 RepID=UPI003AB5DCC0